MSGSRPALLAVFLALSIVAPRAALAQDFTAPAPAWPPLPALTQLESGLPIMSPAVSLVGGVTRWHGLAGLTTRTLALAVGHRAFRAALGLSQTGEPDVGWTALGLAVGAAGGPGGGSLRAVVRRDRTTPFGFDARGAAVGVEIGGGAWIEPRARVHVWASVPQIWARGAAPPLVRPLELGAAMDLGGVAMWLRRDGVPGYPRGGGAEHVIGLVTGSGPLDVWLVARDRPPRGGLGVGAAVRGLRVAAEVQGHPVLGETLRTALVLGGGR